MRRIMLRKTMLFKVFALVGLGAAGCAVTDNTGSGQRRSRWAAMDEKARLNVEPAIPPKILPKTFFAAAQLLEQQRYLEKSIVQYRRAVMSDHNYVAAYHRLGLVLSRTGRNVEAAEALARAVELMPDSAILRNNLGFVYVLQQEWVPAARELRKAVGLNPTFARAQINLGLVLGKLQRFDEAWECLATVLNESDAYYNLGLIYRAQDHYEDAANAFRSALEIDGQFIAAGTQLAQINARLHRQATNEPEEPGKVDEAHETTVVLAETPPADDAFETGTETEIETADADKRYLVVEHDDVQNGNVAIGNTASESMDGEAEDAFASNTATEEGVADVASETSYGPVSATANGVYDPFADEAERTFDFVSAPKAEYEMGRGPVLSDGTGDFDEEPCLGEDPFVDPDFFGAVPITTANATASTDQPFVANTATGDHDELGVPGVEDGAATYDGHGMKDDGSALPTEVIANADLSTTRFPSDDEPNQVPDGSTNDLHFVEGALPLGEHGQPVASRRIPVSWLTPGDPSFDYDELDDSRIAIAGDAMGPIVACDLVASWPEDDLSDSDGVIEPSTLSATIIDENCEESDDHTDLGHIVPLWFAPPM
ncbi:MAG: tetratricopeptide repeat protein, partial [Planctomycetes bacterium]|nr:tetratricopeptide repeat protein [Planctomycetota bacterium]